MFESIKTLRDRLSKEDELEVIHGSHSWMSSFEWHPPVPINTIDQIERNLATSLPVDYKDFLTNLSDGGTLFYDKEFGQWGIKLFRASEIDQKQETWRNSIPSLDWSKRFIAFAELYGEASAMVFDLTRPTQDSISYAVLETSVFDPVDEWAVASRSFHEWLDHLITAQGDKYWEWK
jgi:hypothetical protein